MRFTKVQGLGNDFIIVNGFAETIANYIAAARTLCDRHFGIGADGLVIVLPSEKADFRMRIFNSDGSEAEMCGNVMRCFAKYVYEHGLTTKTRITVETGAGIIIPELITGAHGQITGVCVDMGEPRLKRSQIPMVGNPEEQVIDEPLVVDGQVYCITCVSMGNPHCIIFVEDVRAIDLEKLGPKIETHPAFPRKTNVEFIQVFGRDEIRMRVWERGAGVTLACGTGACAAAVAGALTGKTDRKVTIHLDGGDLFLEWRDDNHVYKTGPAEEVFTGEYPYKL